jgi:hypothetical protein
MIPFCSVVHVPGFENDSWLVDGDGVKIIQ